MWTGPHALSGASGWGGRVPLGGNLQIQGSHRRCPDPSSAMAVRFERPRPSPPLHGVARALSTASPRVRPESSRSSESPCKPSLRR